MDHVGFADHDLLAVPVHDPRPIVALLVMAVCGVESVLYWWLLKPFGIKQPMFWKKSLLELYQEIVAKMDEVGGVSPVQPGGMPYETDGKNINLLPRSELPADVAVRLLNYPHMPRPLGGELPKNKPAATWFCYPPEAPWLRVLPPFWFGTITRGRVYVTAGTGVLVAMGVMIG